MATPAVHDAEQAVLRDPAHRAAMFAWAAVLALDGADRAALGALAPTLKAEFGIGNGAIGLLASAFAIVGALAIVPIGILTDKARRVTILVVCIAIWCLAMGFAAAATSFAVLFAARILLGVLTAAGGPPVTSMIGDLFPVDVRGRVLGWVKSGELVGAGVGFLVAGVVVWLFTWRAVFLTLAVLGIAVAWRVWRIPEPRRGGEDDFLPDHAGASESTQLEELVDEQAASPPGKLVLHGDQSGAPLMAALSYVAHVRTVGMIIGASAFGDVFFTALQTFGVLFLVEQFDLTVSSASLLIPIVGVGGLVGVIAGGRLGDVLIEHGLVNGRLHVGVWSYAATAVVLAPVFVTSSLAVALPFLFVAGALLTAPIAPLEAARLDVVHPQLRGRAESARMIVRVAAQAIAPLVFGVFSERLGGGGAEGLQIAFLTLLPLLAVSSMLLVFARRHYAGEVAAVQASTHPEMADDA
jgi:MFS family permease